jgi:UDP-N-acetylglucosamine/UDP-N-acetylgalactosamine diphosphorylase
VISAPRGIETVEALIAKGVDIPNPFTVDIGPEVDVDRISGDGVRVYPGCRIYGARTVISSGVQLGEEGPVTVRDVRMGPDVRLKAGYAERAVFLERSGMGFGGHVREGCLLEEESGTAHCVGLKQTILFPFVTLGSLINFCDALMAGGTSRRDHSEVGSSYIHFNFTPDGDKTTPSLFGDVPRGVLLNQPPIFLGGQGGAVGPLRVGYGSVVAAGSVLRSDVPDGQLVLVAPPPAVRTPVGKPDYRSAYRIVAKNLGYLAQLCALEAWYRQVRRPFFAAQALGEHVYDGALEMLGSAKQERATRLTAMVAKVEGDDGGSRTQLRDRIGEVLAGYADVPETPADAALLKSLRQAASDGVGYVAAVRALGPDQARLANGWLQGIVDDRWAASTRTLPALARMPHPSPRAAEPSAAG